MTMEEFVLNCVDGSADYDFHMTWKNARENVRFFKQEARHGYELPDHFTVASFRETWNRMRGEK